MLKFTPVESSNIQAVGYDSDTSQLFVQFTSGSIYAYADVAPTTYQALLAAESKGKYFAQHIKPQYAFTRQR